MTERLDRVGQHQLPELLGESLDRALEDDPAVYVLRDFDISLALQVSSVVSDTELARRWAAKLTAAILRQLSRSSDHARSSEGEAELRRFADAVDFRTSFIIDLLEGRAWELWYYGAFGRYRDLEAARAIQATLLEDRDDLPAMLAELMRRGALDRTLDLLGAELMVEIWQQGLAGWPVGDATVVRPLFAAAIDLVDRLELWDGSRASAQALFEDYLAEVPAAVDWQDPQSLAQGVVQAWRFLDRQGQLRSPAAAPVLSTARLDQAVADLDWLDRVWLVDELRHWDEAASAAVDPAVTGDQAEMTETAASASPRQEETLEGPVAGREERGEEPIVSAAERASQSLRPSASESLDSDFETSASSESQELADSTTRPGAAEQAAEDEERALEIDGAAALASDDRSTPVATADGVTETATGFSKNEDSREPSAQPLNPREVEVARLEPETLEATEGTRRDAAKVEAPQGSGGESSGDDSSSAVGTADLRQARDSLGNTSKAAGVRGGADTRAATAPGEASDRREAKARAHVSAEQDLPEAGEPASSGEQPLDAATASGDDLPQPTGAKAQRRQRTPTASLRRMTRESRGDLPERRSASGPTPRQRLLLIDLGASLVRSQGSLERTHPRAASNALRLYGGLIADSPRWSGESLVKPMIEGLLEAWAHLQTASSSSEALLRLSQGRVEDALRLLPEVKRPSARESLRSLANLGEPGRDVVSQLLDISSRTSTRSRRSGSPRSVPQRPAPRQPARRAAEPAATASRPRREPELRSPCAGLFLLARAVEEVRLASLIADSRLPLGDPDSQLSDLLLALGLRWGGVRVTADEAIDPGLAVLAGLAEPPSVGELKSAWSSVEPQDAGRFQTAMLRLLAGQRVIRGNHLELFFVADELAVPAVIAGLDGAAMWPLGKVLQSEDDLPATLAEWIASCESAVGQSPATVTCDAWLGKRLSVSGAPGEILAMPASLSEAASVEALGDTFTAHQQSRELLVSSLDGLQQGALGLPQVDLTVGLTSLVMLRVWARWLKQFSGSSASYLLKNFLRRPGLLRISDDELLIELEPGPMDFVLEMAGYMAPLERVSWLEQRTLRFSVGSQP
ncbi:MAG: hypothetical protein AAF560_18395 [Acidobacteriota bacterium]